MKTTNTHWPVSLFAGVASIVSLLIPVIMSRVLPADQIGNFRVFFLYLQMTPALSLAAGLLNGLYFWAGKGKQGDSAVRSAWHLLAICSVVFPLVSLAAFLFIPGLRALVGGREMAELFAVSIPPMILGAFYENAGVAAGRLWAAGAFAAVFELARTLAIVVAMLLGRDVKAVIIASTAVLWIKTVLGAWLSQRQGLVPRRAPQDTGRSWTGTLSGAREALTYGLPVSASAVLDLLVLSGDRLILSTVLSAAQYAVYAMGCLFLPPLLILEQSVNKVLIPQLSRKLGIGDRRGAASGQRAAIDEMMFFHIAACAGLAVFARPIVEILYTSRYLQAASFLRVYAFWYALVAIPDDAMARASGNSRWILRQTAVFSVVTLAGAAVGARLDGAMGALLAYLAVTLAQKSYALAWVARRLKVSLGELFPYRAVVEYAGVAALLSVASGLMYFRFSSEKAWFLSCGPLFAIFYLAASHALRIRRSRRESLDRLGGDEAPPRVMMVMPYLSLGGLERMVLSLCRELKAGGHAEPSLFAFEEEDGALRPEFENAGIPVVAMDKGPGVSWKLPFRLARVAREHDVSILHTHDLGALIYGVLASWASGGALRVVHTQHGFGEWSGASERGFSKNLCYERFFSRFAESVCAVSEDIAQVYESKVGLRPGRVRTIANGVQFPPEHWAPAREVTGLESRRTMRRTIGMSGASEVLAARQDTLWLLSMARIAFGKGQDRLVRLWNSLEEAERKRATLIFVGPERDPGILRELAQAAKEGIVFAGPTLTPELWYRCADAYVSGSEYEGLPLGPLEAIGRGLPALLSDIPGHRVFREHCRVFASPESGLRELRELMIEIEADDARARLARWDRARPLRERFGSESMACAYAALYRPGRAELSSSRDFRVDRQAGGRPALPIAEEGGQ